MSRKVEHVSQTTRLFSVAVLSLLFANLLSACFGKEVAVGSPPKPVDKPTAVGLNSGKFEVVPQDSGKAVQIFRTGQHIDMMTGLPQRECSFSLDGITSLVDVLALPGGKNVCAIIGLLLAHPDLSESQQIRLMSLANNAVILGAEDMSNACPGSAGCYSSVDNAAIIPNPYNIKTYRIVVHETCHGLEVVKNPQYIILGDVALSLNDTEVVFFGFNTAKASEILTDLCQASWTKWLSTDENFSVEAKMDYFEILLNKIPDSETEDREQLTQLRDQVDAAATWMSSQNTLVFFLEALSSGRVEEAMTYVGEALTQGELYDPVRAARLLAELVDKYGILWNRYK